MHTCIPSHGLKRSWHSCPRRVNTGSRNAPSMNYPRRRNVTTPMIGLRKWSHTQKSHQKWWTLEIYLGTQKKKKILSIWRAVTVRICRSNLLSYTDTGLTSSRSDPIAPGAWQDSHQSTMIQVTCVTWWRINGKYPRISRCRGHPGGWRWTEIY